MEICFRHLSLFYVWQYWEACSNVSYPTPLELCSQEVVWPPCDMLLIKHFVDWLCLRMNEMDSKNIFSFHEDPKLVQQRKARTSYWWFPCLYGAVTFFYLPLLYSLSATFSEVFDESSIKLKWLKECDDTIVVIGLHWRHCGLFIAVW